MAVDVALLFEYLETNGWKLVDHVEDADLILAATCGVHETAEESGFAALAHIDSRRKRGSRLVAIGCLAGICEERLVSTYPDVVVVPPSKSSRLDEIIGARVKLANIPEVRNRAPYIDRALRSMGRTTERPSRRLVRSVSHAFRIDAAHGRLREAFAASRAGARGTCSLRVAWGCAGGCTYCAIRFATGELRSKPLDDVLAEFDAGLAEGFARFELIAGDVGCWGYDIGTSIVELLTGLFERAGAFRLTVDDFNPRWLIRYRETLVPLLAANSEKIESFVVPIQSGSDRVLEQMRRGYVSSEVEATLADLRAAAPRLKMITHVLVGFPGETDADFEDTCNLLTAVRFNRVDAYPYADRPNTLASLLPDKVPGEVIKARCALLKAEFPTVVAKYL